MYLIFSRRRISLEPFQFSPFAPHTHLDHQCFLCVFVFSSIRQNYSQIPGMPLCMPSVAATYNGQVMVGVIYDPHREELFHAVRGRGSFMNGERIYVGEQETIGDAIIAMGSPPAEESMEMSLRGIQALMPKCRTIRMLGSAALMLAWVANGRLTCYWEYDLSSWDISAGALLIQEAGGRFTDLNGEDFTLRTRKMCATNGKVHDEILRVLREEANVI